MLAVVLWMSANGYRCTWMVQFKDNRLQVIQFLVGVNIWFAFFADGKRTRIKYIQIRSMEFSEDFAIVQGSLISIQKTVGDLQFLSSKNGK
jgi:hypothetical protein